MLLTSSNDCKDALSQGGASSSSRLRTSRARRSSAGHYQLKCWIPLRAEHSPSLAEAEWGPQVYRFHGHQSQGVCVSIVSGARQRAHTSGSGARSRRQVGRHCRASSERRCRLAVGNRRPFIRPPRVGVGEGGNSQMSMNNLPFADVHE